MPGLRARRWAGGAAVALALSSAALTACAPTQSSPRGNWQPAGAALIDLARPVTGVDQDGLVIRERDSGRLVPVTLLCKSGSTDVDCSASRINHVWVLPTQPLIFGQYYRICFAARLLDSQGRPPITGNATFRAGTRDDDQSSAAVYSWATRGNRAAWGGSYVVESMYQARASITFTGNSTIVWTATGPTGGLMDVYVDRQLRRTVDTYSAATRFRVPVIIGGLTPSGHRLDVVARGAKGSSASRGTDIVIDGVSSPSGSLPTPAFEYGWANAVSSMFSQGMASSSTTSGATVSLLFRGTSIEVGTIRGPFSGVYRAFLDGKAVGDFTDSSSVLRVASRRFFASGDVLHRLSLTVMGRHTAGSIASAVTVDYWQLPASEGAVVMAQAPQPITAGVTP
ncbi:MAG TPA: hypothetical protein VHZ96_20345 [Frankiaceae bacterium]|nr:hypothetical protein [Frankiaceae bacterium]